MTIDLKSHDRGCIVAVRATPNAKLNRVQGVRDGVILVSVTQVAEKGKANKAIKKLLAKSLGLRQSQIQLIRGETSRDKLFLLESLDMEAARIAVQESIGG